PGFIDAHNHLASMAVSKLGVNLSGIVGRDAVPTAIRRWVADQTADAPLRGYAWMPDSFEDRSPRREWLDEITGDRPMYLFSADAHDNLVQHRGDACGRYRRLHPRPGSRRAVLGARP
ncbi:MAG TPA: amidohydrolase family protein, partial [Mycolicibacterium fallax]|nr:amidohydrolase family protein [Mycolicibacterium fallax]